MPDIRMRDFGKRVSRIDRKHKRMADGYVSMVDSDGTITGKPTRRSFSFPWKPTAIFFTIFFVVKALLLVQLGQPHYNDLVADLQDGSTVEKVGAYVMSADPMTKWLAAQIQWAID